MSSIEHTRTFIIAEKINEVFPLFNPEEEGKWAPGWCYENVMGNQNFNKDYVFLTNNHDHRTTKAIWIISDYDKSKYSIQYYKIETEVKIGVITIKCYKIRKMKTKVSVTYRYIALSEVGENFIRDFTENEYEKFINEWEMLINEYQKKKNIK